MPKKFHFFFTILVTCYLLLVACQTAFADIGVALPNPLGTTNVPKIIGNMILVFMGGAGAIALLFFIYGGFLWLTSQGNPETIKKGKDILLWAVLGMVLMFGSYIVTNFVINTLTVGAGIPAQTGTTFK